MPSPRRADVAASGSPVHADCNRASIRALPAAELLDAWPLVRCDMRDVEHLSFKVLRVRRSDAVTGDALCTARPRTGLRIALAFSWIMVQPNVLALKDMLDVCSNALLFDSTGILPHSVRSAHLAGVVYQMPWQAEVARRLQ